MRHHTNFNSYYDPPDDPGEVVREIRNGHRTAVANYKCSDCGQPIYRGTKYFYVVYADEDDAIHTAKRHGMFGHCLNEDYGNE